MAVFNIPMSYSSCSAYCANDFLAAEAKKYIATEEMDKDQP